MFQFMQTWDGETIAKFGKEHIGYIRKAMLYSWLTSSHCCLDLTSLLIFKEGYYIFFCVTHLFLLSELHWYREGRSTTFVKLF